MKFAIVLLSLLSQVCLAQSVIWPGGSGNATAIQGTPVSVTPPTSGEVLQFNSTSGKWEPATVSGTGTVTSVNASVPATLLTISGNPITGSGTLAFDLATQNQNRLLIGPVSGADAQPTFRLLVPGDLPGGTNGKYMSFDVSTGKPGASPFLQLGQNPTSIQAVNASFTVPNTVTSLEGYMYNPTVDGAALAAPKAFEILGDYGNTSPTILTNLKEILLAEQYHDNITISGGYTGIQIGPNFGAAASVDSFNGIIENANIQLTSMTSLNSILLQTQIGNGVPASISDMSSVNVSPTIGATSNVTNYNGLNVSPNFVSGSTTTSFKGITVDPQGSISAVNAVGIDIHMNNITASNSKNSIATSGGTVVIGSDNNLISSASFQTGNSIGIQAHALTAITGTDYIGNSLLTVFDAQDNVANGPTGLGVNQVGYIGQMGVASGKTVAQFNGAVSGYSFGAATGSITDTAAYVAAGPIGPGATVTNSRGFYVPALFNNSGGTVTNAWGIYVAPSNVDNFLKKNLIIGGSTGLPIGANSLEVNGSEFVTKSATDSGVSAGIINASSDTTVDGSNTTIGINGTASATVQSGATNDKALAGMNFVVTHGDTTDQGTLHEMDGANALLFNNSDTTGLLDKAYGYHSTFFSSKGTTTDYYGFYSERVPSGPGVLTNNWGIYVVNDNDTPVKNYLSGRTQIGGSSPSISADASLELKASDKALLLNRVDTATEGGLAAVNGMQLYNTDTNKFRCYENGAWADCIGGGGGGANTALSNLASVAINSDLIFGAAVVGTLKTKDNLSSDSSSLFLKSGDTDSSDQSGDVNLASGSGGDFSGNINISSADVISQSGGINIHIGSAGTRGKIQLQDGSEGTAGYVWLSTDTVGSGTWAPLNTNATSLQGTAISSTPPSSGQVLQFNSTSNQWESATVAGTGTVTSVSSGTGLLGGPITGAGTLSVDVGTGANQIVQLNGSGHLPALDGFLLTNLNVTGSGSSGAAGSVQFSDGSGGFSSNGSNFFWDDSTQRLGVHTASPSVMFQVAGTTGFFARLGSTAGAHFDFSTNQIASFTGGGSSSFFINNDSTGNVYMVTGGGQVAINTFSPNSVLGVGGAITMNGSSSGFVGFQGATNAGSVIYTLPSSDGSSGQVLTTNGTNTLSWATAQVPTPVSNKLIFSGTAPTLGSCGTSPSIVGNDSAGRITVGTGGIATSCAITFAAAWTNAPLCFVSDESALIATQVVPTTTNLTISATAPFAASSKLAYHCVGYQ